MPSPLLHDAFASCFPHFRHRARAQEVAAHLVGSASLPPLDPKLDNTNNNNGALPSSFNSRVAVCCQIQVRRDMDADPNSATRMVELMGTPEAIATAEKLINEVLTEAKASGSGIITQKLTGQSRSDKFLMKNPNNKLELKSGELFVLEKASLVAAYVGKKY